MLVLLWINRREREEFKVISVVKPGAFESLDRDAGLSGERKRVDGQLRNDVLLLLRLGLVVKDVDVACAKLHEVNVASDRMLSEREGEALGAKDGEVFRCEEDRNLDGDGGRIIEQHEMFHRIVTFFV